MPIYAESETEAQVLADNELNQAMPETAFTVEWAVQIGENVLNEDTDKWEYVEKPTIPPPSPEERARINAVADARVARAERIQGQRKS